MFPWLLSLQILSCSGFPAPDPGRFSSSHEISRFGSLTHLGVEMDDDTSRWDGAFGQFGVGMFAEFGGVVAGGLVGAVVGGAIGRMVYGKRREPDKVEPLYRISSEESAMAFGAVAGMLGGAVVASGRAVHRDAEERTIYASKPWWATLGALVGLGVGAGMVAVGAKISDNAAGWALVAAPVIPPLGAVIFDRLAADAPVGYSLVPWLPNGRKGVVAQVEF